MLEIGDPLQEIVQAVGPLKCDVELPPSWKDDVDPTRPLPTTYDERRRYPRFHYRVCAALQYRQTFPTLDRPDTWHKVFTRDLSRGGLSFLHSEPLFPRERMRIALPEKGIATIEVVWSTRVQERCFHVGARFVERFRRFTA